MNVGQRIKQRRKELDLSVDKLAEMLGKNRATVYRYENGEIENLPLDILKPIAEALSTTPQHLMGWDEEEEKPVDFDGLSDKKKALIEFALSVPEDKASMVLRVLKSIVEDD